MTHLDDLREKVMESCRTGYTPDRALKNLEDEYRRVLSEVFYSADHSFAKVQHEASRDGGEPHAEHWRLYFAVQDARELLGLTAVPAED